MLLRVLQKQRHRSSHKLGRIAAAGQSAAFWHAMNRGWNGLARLRAIRGLKVRQGQSFIRGNLKPCGRGEMAYAPDLSANLSARRETGDAELLKVGEPCNMAIPSQARPERVGKV